MQANVLDRRPDNRKATGLRRKDVDLIRPLPHVALRGFRWHWWSEYVGASSRVNPYNVNRCSSSSDKLRTASGYR